LYTSGNFGDGVIAQHAVRNFEAVTDERIRVCRLLLPDWNPDLISGKCDLSRVAEVGNRAGRGWTKPVPPFGDTAKIDQ
jgi:hypothetical protein